MSARCVSTIASPWRMGMTVTCDLSEGHDGLHRWRGSHLDDAEVHWAGQHDHYTGKERANRARREEIFRQRDAARLARVERFWARRSV